MPATHTHAAPPFTTPDAPPSPPASAFKRGPSPAFAQIIRGPSLNDCLSRSSTSSSTASLVQGGAISLPRAASPTVGETQPRAPKTRPPNPEARTPDPGPRTLKPETRKAKPETRHQAPASLRRSSSRTGSYAETWAPRQRLPLGMMAGRRALISGLRPERNISMKWNSG